MNFYNKQEFSMNLCNFQQFLKLSRINKIFQIISLLNKKFLRVSLSLQNNQQFTKLIFGIINNL
jgi:hypothetical protein